MFEGGGLGGSVPAQLVRLREVGPAARVHRPELDGAHEARCRLRELTARPLGNSERVPDGWLAWRGAGGLPRERARFVRSPALERDDGQQVQRVRVRRARR